MWSIEIQLFHVTRNTNPDPIFFPHMTSNLTQTPRKAPDHTPKKRLFPVTRILIFSIFEHFEFTCAYNNVI